MVEFWIYPGKIKYLREFNEGYIPSEFEKAAEWKYFTREFRITKGKRKGLEHRDNPEGGCGRQKTMTSRKGEKPSLNSRKCMQKIIRNE